MSEHPLHRRETVPYGYAYGLESFAAQEALRHAAIIVLDEALLTLSEVHSAQELQGLAEDHADPEIRRVLGTLDVQPDPIAVAYRLPDIYRDRYGSYGFLKNWAVTVSVVGWKLAQPTQHQLTNVAEELAMHALIEEGLSHLELKGALDAAGQALHDLYDQAFEDTDFLELYELKEVDDIADIDPDGNLGVTDMRFQDWFAPFGSGADRGVSHPFLLD